MANTERHSEVHRPPAPEQAAQHSLNLKALLGHMFMAREGDRREGILFRQGRGWFQVGGAGHESIAAVAPHLRPEDAIFPCYRDRALMLARGMTNYELALAFFAKAKSSSGGRMMPAHYSSRRLNVFSVATPVGMQCLPATGYAWSFKQSGEGNVVVCTIGDAATRQGEFYEALCFAQQEKLPVIFVVEDNGYGISTPTKLISPRALCILSRDHVHLIDARDPRVVFESAGEAISKAREGGGPSLLWCEIDRLQSHTSSDDHRVYRPAEEIEALASRDPIANFAAVLISEGLLTEAEWKATQDEIAAQVSDDYERAQKEAEPDPDSVTQHLYGKRRMVAAPHIEPGEMTMVDAINQTLRHALEKDPKVLMFGEDIEDPKGGVFGLTRGLSKDFPGRVKNSPLAEGTIAGVGIGLAAAGYRPVFELQFVDFIGPALNQIMTHLGTLRWRSAGDWKCPLVLIAPYGAYLPAGGPWHSEALEGMVSTFPGIDIVIPSNPADAASLLWSAIRGDDPVLFCVPKHIFRKKEVINSELQSIPLGKAKLVQEGNDVTVVTWGNCVELCTEAASQIGSEASLEIVDLRSIVPCDWGAIRISLEKTGRLVVVHEDRRTGGFGESIITEFISDAETWKLFYSPPQLVARQDTYIPYNPRLEYAALPSVASIVEAVRMVMEQ